MKANEALKKYKENPVLFIEDVIGVKPTDEQKHILNMMETSRISTIAIYNSPCPQRGHMFKLYHQYLTFMRKVDANNNKPEQVG